MAIVESFEMRMRLCCSSMERESHTDALMKANKVITKKCNKSDKNNAPLIQGNSVSCLILAAIKKKPCNKEDRKS